MRQAQEGLEEEEGDDDDADDGMGLVDLWLGRQMEVNEREGTGWWTAPVGC